jgi:outer membrane protein
VLVPLSDEFIDTTETNSDLAYGGSLIYGFTRHLAGELDVTHAPSLDLKQSRSKVGESSLTNISLGIQYRFTPDNRVVPYLGGGIDMVKGEFVNVAGDKFDLSWTVGGHLNAGMDFFITKGIAFSADVRGIYAARGDVGSTRFHYDPTSFIGTIGFRLFLPERLSI